MVGTAKTKSMVDSEGRKVPKHTYLRKSAKGWVYYITFNIGKAKYVLNSGILESAENSRERVEKRVAYERAAASKPEAPQLTATSLAAICLAEIARREEETPNSPDISHVKRRLRRITDFFGPSRDVRTVGMQDALQFVEARRKERTRHGTAPKYGTIFEALFDLRRAVKLANEHGVLDPPYELVLPRRKKDGEKIAPLSAKHRPHEECVAFIHHSSLPRWLSEMCQVVYGSGMRAGEVMALRPSWLRKDKNRSGQPRYLIVLPKVLYNAHSGDDIDFPIEVSAGTWQLLQRLADATTDNRPIFGQRTVAIAMAKTSRAMGLGMTLTLRDLRASYGRRVYEHFGKNIEMARIALRHTDHETTRIYISVAQHDSHGIAEFASTFDMVPKKRMVQED